jgi:hypothetical protein
LSSFPSLKVAWTLLKMPDAQDIHPQTKHENRDQVKECFHENRGLTVHEVGNKLWISFGSVHSILTDDLNMGLNVTKSMLHLLSEEQKENCVNMCEVVPHPLYSPDLVPCNFFLFPELVWWY